MEDMLYRFPARIGIESCDADLSVKTKKLVPLKAAGPLPRRVCREQLTFPATMGSFSDLSPFQLGISLGLFRHGNSSSRDFRLGDRVSWRWVQLGVDKWWLLLTFSLVRKTDEHNYRRDKAANMDASVHLKGYIARGVVICNCHLQISL